MIFGRCEKLPAQRLPLKSLKIDDYAESRRSSKIIVLLVPL